MRRAALLAVLCACGGYTPASFCTASYQASCQKIFQCNVQGTLFTSEADCEQKESLQFDCGSTQSENVCAGQGSGMFNASAAGQCLHDIQSLSCDAVKSSGFTLPSTCAPSAICS
jgi:hypothetical protein